MKITIGTKLAASFLVIVIIFIPLVMHALSISEESLEESTGENSVVMAETMLDRIDYSIFLKHLEIHQLAHEPSVLEAVGESNREFENLDDIQGYMNLTDEEWTSVAKDEITPFMQELLDNNLSVYLNEKYLEHYQKNHGYRIFAHVSLINKYGAIISLTNKTMRYAYPDAEWWIAGRDNKTYIGDVEICGIPEINAITLSSRIEDKDGNFLGVVHGVLDMPLLVKEAEITSKTRSYTEVRLMTKDGRLIYSSETFMFLEDVSDKEFFKKIGSENGYFETNEGEREKFFSYAHSRGYGSYEGYGWILGVERDREEVLEPVFSLRENLMVASFLFIVLGIAIAIILARSLSKPIKTFQHAALVIAGGDLDKRVEISSHDEIGELSKAFNEMTSKLNDSYTGLEEKIQERTAELRKSEEKYGILFNNISDPIFIFDKETHCFLDCNRSAVENYGYSKDELQAMTPLDLHPIEEKEKVKRNIGAKNVGELHSYTHLAKDGRQIDVEILTNETLYERQPAWISIARDVTERKEHERHLLNVVANTSHLINTPLTVASGHMDLVRMGLKEMTPELAYTIHKKLQNIRELVIEGLTQNLILLTEETHDGWTPVKKKKNDGEPKANR